MCRLLVFVVLLLCTLTGSVCNLLYSIYYLANSSIEGATLNDLVVNVAK